MIPAIQKPCPDYPMIVDVSLMRDRHGSFWYSLHLRPCGGNSFPQDGPLKTENLDIARKIIESLIAVKINSDFDITWHERDLYRHIAFSRRRPG